MRVECSTKKGRAYEGGNRILRYKIGMPRIEGCDVINKFYADIAERCETFCVGRLREELAERGSGEYVYELSYISTHNDGNILSLLMRARLICSGVVEKEQVRAQIWSLSDQDMIPPRYVIKRFGGKAKRRFRRTAVFVCDGELRELLPQVYDALCQKKQN